MKINNLIVSFLAVSVCAAVGAQTSYDAAKLYEEELNGTARYVGMGGAMSALGSDASVISHNPAGIGTYHNSDINLSLGFFGTSVNMDPLYTASFKGATENGLQYYSNNSKSDLNMALDNVSFIFSGYDGDDTYMNFGFSYRKLQNMDRFMDYRDKFYIYDNNEVRDVRYHWYEDHQRNKINSFDFNLSCNLSDIVYLGWTLGILGTDTWSEGYFYDFLPSYQNAEQEDKYLLQPTDGIVDSTSVDKMNTANGSGWNMAFGLIIRPVRALRLGVSVKTPTWYRQELDYVDYLYAFMGDDYTDENGNAIAENRSVIYKFSSPWSLNLSAGLTFAKTAIGVEYEKHFTQRSSLSIGNTKMTTQGAIDYQDYSSVKFGIEQNISNLSLRAGYNYIESMFNNNSYPYLFDSEFNNDNPVGRMDFQNDRLGKTQYCTCGIGYCSTPDRDGTQFYIDLAYVHGIRRSVLNMNEYDFGLTEYNFDTDVNYKYITDKVLLTVGWNF